MSVLSSIVSLMKKGSQKVSDYIDNNRTKAQSISEEVIKMAISEVLGLLNNEDDKQFLTTYATLITVLAKQGIIVLDNAMYYMRKLEIEKAISLALQVATEEEKNKILRDAADNVYAAAIESYEDMEKAKFTISLIASLLLSKLGTII